MTASATIITDQTTNVLLVPNKALTTLGGNKVVYLLVNGQVNPVTVKVGLASDTQTEVTSTGLKESDVVVTNPSALTTTTTSTGVTSIFSNLFKMLGVTSTGGNAGGSSVAGGAPLDFGGGNPPSGTPPAGGPSGGQPPSGSGG